MPHEARGLGEASEVVGADVVLVDVGFCCARGCGLDGGADVGSSVELSYDVEARRVDDVPERAARLDREADRAATDGQAGDAFGSLRGEEQCCGGADVGTDDVRSAEAPLVDQTGEERSSTVWGDELGATVGVAEARRVDCDDPPQSCAYSSWSEQVSYGQGSRVGLGMTATASARAEAGRTPS